MLMNVLKSIGHIYEKKVKADAVDDKVHSVTHS